MYFSAANTRKKKVYEQQENEENPLRCPVKLYEFYLSKWWVNKYFPIPTEFVINLSDFNSGNKKISHVFPHIWNTIINCFGNREMLKGYFHYLIYDEKDKIFLFCYSCIKQNFYFKILCNLFAAAAEKTNAAD